jgi:nitrite reductase/ring-hydroxylating ferredoxin subunit
MTRRKFFRLLGVGAVIGFVYKYFRPTSTGRSRQLAVSALSVPKGGALVMPEQHTAVISLQGGPLALDMTCTHLGCIVQPNENGFLCPCHGSAFAPDGSLLKGPAKKPLLRLPVHSARDRLIVNLQAEA